MIRVGVHSEKGAETGSETASISGYHKGFSTRGLNALEYGFWGPEYSQ